MHTDGAEFYSNSEYLVFSMGSIFAEGHVWDCKFPCIIIPHSHMIESNVKKLVHETASIVFAWSLRAASSGVFPSHGPFGEEMDGFRRELANTPLSGGWRACYFGFRYDAKARKETNYFPRSYQRNFVCESCLASKTRKSCAPALSYKNFYPTAGYRMTTISVVLSC